MGNVLLRYDPMLTCRRHGKTPENAQRLRDVIFGAPEWAARMDAGTMTHDEFVALVQSRLETDELRAMAAAALGDWIQDALYPVEGMAALVSHLHQKGYKLYVLSNMSLRFREVTYKIPGYDLFSGALVSAEEKLLKPDAAIFARLCDKYGLKPQECLFVDDLPQNVEGAVAFGMQGYCFADGDVKRLAAHLDALCVKGD